MNEKIECQQKTSAYMFVPYVHEDSLLSNHILFGTGTGPQTLLIFFLLLLLGGDAL